MSDLAPASEPTSSAEPIKCRSCSRPETERVVKMVPGAQVVRPIGSQAPTHPALDCKIFIGPDPRVPEADDFVLRFTRDLVCERIDQDEHRTARTIVLRHLRAVYLMGRDREAKPYEKGPGQGSA